ncbi:mannose-1-phosphate guanylyltransferase/mannose-6-phosphate isomerase [Parvularcula oceani]|uniref:mannose-1-phosphate guanylyltransferase/mannose-6-phosphate isomerase n=1 Tax=Parvularcula oceani TaxID=1247963 RepID=UPI000562A04F|nr:mannose-1-phosphate guanylyltransferase/mannose-6-phosphate isomerase [Parvularcula oceani]
MSSITPIIMSGGAGTRLWPLSRKSEPKQYRALVTNRSMLEETVARLEAGGQEVARPVVICGDAHCGKIRTLLTRDGAAAPVIITEPVGRNTAPVAIVASLHVAKSDPEGLVLLLPADHHIRDAQGFWEAVNRGRAAAERGHLVTLGIAPTGPETGYGYIRRGAPLTDGVYAVDAFVEKPDAETAERYLREGGYAWNAGIFLFRARDLLAEAQTHVPQMVEEARKAYDRAAQEDGTLRLDEASFAQVPADSIDYAIMERTDKAAVVDPVNIGWDDIGSWSAVAEHALEGGALEKGDVLALDCEGSHIRSDGPLVAAIGVKDVIIIATGDAVLVVDKTRAQDVKTIVEKLKAEGRSEIL